jgi:branched-chain amino acid transport system ATP-binding protein
LATVEGLKLSEQFPRAGAPIFGRTLMLAPGNQVHVCGEDTTKLQMLFRYLIGERKCETGTKWLDGVDVSLLDCRGLMRLGLAAGGARSRVFASLSIEEHFRIRAAVLKSAQTGDYWLSCARKSFSVLRSVPRTVCGNFSGGEQQTLMLSLATVGSPRIVILEEPWTGLSIAAQQDVRAVLRELTDNGTTVVCLTQDKPKEQGEFSLTIDLDDHASKVRM